MGKKIKLNLDDLKVKSFVTSLQNNEKERLRGGVQPCCSEDMSGGGGGGGTGDGSFQEYCGGGGTGGGSGVGTTDYTICWSYPGDISRIVC